MLVDFAIANDRSFNEAQKLSMVAPEASKANKFATNFPNTEYLLNRPLAKVIKLSRKTCFLSTEAPNT